MKRPNGFGFRFTILTTTTHPLTVGTQWQYDSLANTFSLAAGLLYTPFDDQQVFDVYVNLAYWRLTWRLYAVNRVLTEHADGTLK